MIVLGIFINFSYFFAEQTLNLNELISNSIKEIGKTVLNKEISFSNIIKELNSVISIGSSSFDIFSLDGIIKGFYINWSFKFTFNLLFKICYGTSFYLTYSSFHFNLN